MTETLRDPMQRLINEARHFWQDYERYANDEDRESPDPNALLDAIAAAEADSRQFALIAASTSPCNEEPAHPHS